MARLPVYYIPHGAGPCFFMDWIPENTWPPLAAWMRALPASLPERPSALLVISAHWEEPLFTVSENPAPGLYFDYYGFPLHTYELRWPAPAAVDLLPALHGALERAGVPFDRNTTRDFDHGVFIPGLLAFPEADIPTVQISLRQDFDPAAHIALGRALAPLRDQGVLILGSGMSYHNMQAFRTKDNAPIAGADTFAAWLKETIADVDPEARAFRLTHWAQASGARSAHPREDHLLPLLVAAGAAGTDPGREAFFCRAMGAPLSVFAFGRETAES